MRPLFSIEPLNHQRQQAMISGGAWREGSPVPFDRLRSVFISYRNFQGSLKHDGELIVLDAVAPAACCVFQELLARNFPIHSIRPIEEFNANDEQSVLANNSSAFCFRTIENSTTLSVHSYGVAIDINTFINPYIDPLRNPGGTVEIRDDKLDYLMRSPLKPGMVEPIVDVFKKYGFCLWGGSWDGPLDYHHFQPTRTQAKIMITLPPDHALTFFDLCQRYQMQAMSFEWTETSPPNQQTRSVLEWAEKDGETFSSLVERLLIEQNCPSKSVIHSAF